MTDHAASTPQGLYDAVKASAPGDTVTLAGGNYPWVDLSSLVVADPGVVIAPASGAAVSFGQLVLSGSAGLHFKGIEIYQQTPAGQPVTWMATIYAINAARLVFESLNVHSDDGTLKGLGLTVRDSKQVSVLTSEFHSLGVAVSLLDSSDVACSGNHLHNCETDGFDVAGSSNVSIAGNQIASFTPQPGDHPDAIQFWATTANPSPSGNKVTGNDIRRGSGQPIQGIFVEGQTGIQIIGNGMTGTMFNGISLSTCAGGSIDGNFVQGDTDMGSQIIVRGGSTNVTAAANTVSEPIQTYSNPAAVPPEPPPVNFQERGTLTVAVAAVGDTSALDAWWKAQGTSPVPIPVPPAPAPPPVPAPPIPAPVDPLQGKLDAANAQIATLQTQNANLTTQLTASTQNAMTLQTQLSSANAKLAAKNKALTGIAATATAAAK